MQIRIVREQRQQPLSQIHTLWEASDKNQQAPILARVRTMQQQTEQVFKA